MMPCPHCGEHVKVYNSHRRPKEVRRTYHCPCGTCFRTKETVTYRKDDANYQTHSRTRNIVVALIHAESEKKRQKEAGTSWAGLIVDG